MSDFTKQLKTRIEIDKQKQKKREDALVNYLDSLLPLLLIVEGKSYLNETKLKALKKIKKLFSEDAYEYALKVYRDKQKNVET